MTRNFYVRTCIKFTYANQIEAMHEKSLVSVKVEPRSTCRLSSALFTLRLFSFTWLKFTCVNVRSQKRVSGNQPYRNLPIIPTQRPDDLSWWRHISSKLQWQQKKKIKYIDKLPWWDHLLLGVPTADAYFLPLVSTVQTKLSDCNINLMPYTINKLTRKNKTN